MMCDECAPNNKKRCKLHVATPHRDLMQLSNEPSLIVQIKIPAAAGSSSSLLRARRSCHVDASDKRTYMEICSCCWRVCSGSPQ